MRPRPEPLPPGLRCWLECRPPDADEIVTSIRLDDVGRPMARFDGHLTWLVWKSGMWHDPLGGWAPEVLRPARLVDRIRVAIAARGDRR